MDEQFEKLKRVFVKQIKEDGYTKTTEDLKKHYEKLKRALKEARREITIEKRRIRSREYQRKYRTEHIEEMRAKSRVRSKTYYYEVQKNRRRKDSIKRLEERLKRLKESDEQ